LRAQEKVSPRATAASCCIEKAAKSIFALPDEQIRQLIENGQFEEVKKHG
jgi:hypothetical protein